MSDVKLLNLDELAIIERVVQFGGAQYKVAEQTVDQMISRMQATKNSGEDLNDPLAFLADMRQTVQDILPSMPKKVVGGLSLEKMIRIVEFLNDKELNDAAADMLTVTKEAEDKGEPEKKS